MTTTSFDSHEESPGGSSESDDSVVVLNNGQLAAALTSWGRQIRAYRTARRLSVRELAHRAGVSKTRVSDIETGKHPNPSLATLLRIQAALGITSLEAVLGDTPSMQLIHGAAQRPAANAAATIITFAREPGFTEEATDAEMGTDQ